MVTISVAIVRLVHNLKIVTNNSHIPKECVQEWKHFYSMTCSSCGISMEKLLPKMEAKCTVGYIIVHKIPWLQKSTHFCCLATFLVTFANRGNNSSLNANGCTQTHADVPAQPFNGLCSSSLTHAYVHICSMWATTMLLAGTMYIYCQMF